MTPREFAEILALFITAFFYIEARARQRQASRFMRESTERHEAIIRERVASNEFRLKCIDAAVSMGVAFVEAQAKMPAPMTVKTAKKRHLQLID